MADQQQQARSGGEGAPVQQPPLANTEDPGHSIHVASDYGATGSTTAMNNALSPVDENRQSRPKPTQNATSAQLSTSTTALLPTSDYPHSAAIEQVVAHGGASGGISTVSAPHLTNNSYYHNPALGPLTPPRSPLAGEVMYHNHHHQQAMHVSGGAPITPPRKPT